MRQLHGRESLARLAIDLTCVGAAMVFTFAFFLGWMPGDLATLLVGICLLPSMYMAAASTRLRR
jgi:hypothetical protein